MKTYSVKEIAKIVHKNPETVRRWIRSGKLQAQQNSRKDGNLVTEEDLYSFLKTSNKYVDIAETMRASNPALTVISLIGTAVGASIVSYFANSKETINSDNFQIVSRDLKKDLESKCQETINSIEKKEEAIKQLRDEINQAKQNIKDYEAVLRQITESGINKIKEGVNE